MANQTLVEYWDEDEYGDSGFDTEFVSLESLNLNKPHLETIEDVFDKHINIPIDRDFMLRVLTYVNNFLHKDENNIAFFGSSLIGHYQVKFTSEDEFEWWNSVLMVDDYDSLKKDIVKQVSPYRTYRVADNPINLSFIWVCYSALISTTFSEKDREALARAALNMMQYKFISSLHSHRFKYVADIGIATAVYEQLDRKSILKREGSWQALVEYRTQDILGIDRLHTKTIRTFRSDEDVVKMVNDIWNRLKSLMNILTTDFHNIIATNAKFASTTKFTTIEGELILKDSFDAIAHVKRNMQMIIPDKNSFIKDDLLEVVHLTIDTVYPKYLKNTLSFISENYRANYKYADIPVLIDDVIMYAFDVIKKENIDIKDITSVALKLRSQLRSSRVIDTEFVRIKKLMEPIIEDSNPRITNINMASTRIGALLYIILRSLIQK